MFKFATPAVMSTNPRYATMPRVLRLYDRVYIEVFMRYTTWTISRLIRKHT